MAEWIIVLDFDDVVWLQNDNNIFAVLCAYL